jgi:hypothetical protein
MCALKVVEPAHGPAISSRRGRGATRVVIGVLGTLVGLAGVEHGVGEVLQGPGRADGVVIMSWPDAEALEILSGEPAMTVIPDLLVTGLLAIAVGVGVAVWSVGFAHRRHGGLVLIGLSVLLLLVGGGLAPPLMGVALGSVAMRSSRRSRPPGPLGSRLAPFCPWFLAGSVVGYLGLMPGMLLAHRLGIASAALVLGLGTLAFAGLALALIAARAHDRSVSLVDAEGSGP